MIRPSNPVLLICFLLFTVLGGAAVLIWRSNRNEKWQLATTAKLIENGSPEQALEIINAQGDVAPPTRWFSMKVDCLVALRRIESMKTLYYQYPSYFSENESAALVVARSLSNAGSDASYDALRNQWRGRELNRRAWLALDVDDMVRSGRTDSAIQQLEDKDLPTGGNSGRLTRLALLNASDGNLAWSYLEQAYRDNPRDPTVRLFRAQMLEASGRIPEARVEYVAACVADNSNPALHDQLAQFYRRRGNLYQAMTSWTQGVENATSDFLEYSVLFWSRVAHPAQLSWAGRQLSSGRCRPLVKYLVTLPQADFWDETLWEESMKASLVEGKETPETLTVPRPEIAWLKVLHFLRVGENEQASKILREARADLEPLEPTLYRSLVMSMDYHQTGRVDPREEWEFVSTEDSPEHRFLLSMEAFHQSQRRQSNPSQDSDLRVKSANAVDPQEDTTDSGTALFEELQPKEAIVACLMANGWVEAAIRIDDAYDGERGADKTEPTWLQYALAQARRMNRDATDALDYLARCTDSPELKLVEGEILLGEGRVDEAEKRLLQLCERRDAIGRRAAWLVCIQWIDQERFEDVRTVLKSHTSLDQSVIGKELLARVLYAEGQQDAATQLLAQIQSDSPQATAFLARQAYQRRDFDESQRLTRELQRQLPDSMAVRANLQRIEAAREKSSTP